jgi:hydrogenase large subunit
MAVAHYLDALAWQRQIVQLQTIFGGKNPHPNVLVGGAPPRSACMPARARAPRPSTRSACKRWPSSSSRCADFVDQVYLPDVLAIASFYKDWFKTGYGEGTGNFLTYGDFPAPAARTRRPSWCRAARFWGAICPTSRRSI